MKVFWGTLLFILVITIITQSWIPIVAVVVVLFLMILLSVLLSRKNGDKFTMVVIDKSELSDEYKKFIEETEEDRERMH